MVEIFLTLKNYEENYIIGDRFRYVVERYKPILFSPPLAPSFILMQPSHPPTQSWNNNLNKTKLIHLTLNKLKSHIADSKQFVCDNSLPIDQKQNSFHVLCLQLEYLRTRGPLLSLSSSRFNRDTSTFPSSLIKGANKKANKK